MRNEESTPNPQTRVTPADLGRTSASSGRSEFEGHPPERHKSRQPPPEVELVSFLAHPCRCCLFTIAAPPGALSVQFSSAEEEEVTGTSEFSRSAAEDFAHSLQTESNSVFADVDVPTKEY